MNARVVEDILDARARLGESPVWDGARQQLAWVDVYNHRVHQYSPATGDDRYFDTGDVVSAVALAGPDRLLLALRDKLAFLHLPSGEVEVLQRCEFSRSDTRFNDGKCDARGRFWIGSISTEPGEAALYRVDLDGSLRVMETGLTISNGLGWSPDGATFYLTDSPTRKIYAYRFDADSGSIHDRRVLVDLGDEAVEPDGLAIDREGNLWSALWDGGCIARFDAQGRPIERVPVPPRRPTSVAFGGEELRELYVTSASVGLSQSEIQDDVTAGDLFRIATGTAGMTSHPFANGSRH
jgi:sugar lactone lactonase YvrE